MDSNTGMHAWVTDTRAQMLAAYNRLTDPGDKMEFLQNVARELDVPKSQVLLFLRSSSPVNIEPKKQ